MSSNNSGSGNSNRNGFIFPDFSLRRLLLQTTRTGRTPFTTRMCDVERGGASNGGGGVVANGIGNNANGSKHEKTNHGSASNNGNNGGDVSSSKVSSLFVCFILFCFQCHYAHYYPGTPFCN